MKAALYARHGVPEYWLLDLVAGAVLVHRDPRESGYALLRRAAPGEMLEVAALPGLHLAMDDLLR